MAEAVGDAALLIPSGTRTAHALARVSEYRVLRERLIEHGLSVVWRHTLEAESGRAAAFMRRELARLPAVRRRHA